MEIETTETKTKTIALLAIIVAAVTASTAAILPVAIPAAHAQECVIPQASCAAVFGLNTANRHSNDHACPGLSTGSQQATGAPIPCG
jgi:hypothetical protein